MSMLSKENTNEIFEDIKRNLTRGVKDRKHTFHTPVFCNVDNENNIESRVVVLRQFDSPNMVLNFHTDFRSPKVLSLKQNNNSLFVLFITVSSAAIIKLSAPFKSDSSAKRQACPTSLASMYPQKFHFLK